MWRRTKACRRVSGSPGKLSAEEDHGAQSAGFAIHRGFGSVDIVPDLRGDKRYKQGEDDAQRGQHAGRDTFECACSLAHGQGRNDPVDHARRQVRPPKHDKRHPEDGKIVQPIDHVRLLFRDHSQTFDLDLVNSQSS